jgi:hypothetical protein
MKKNPQIKYSPVGNGDTSLITLKDNTTILIDCRIRESAKGEKDDSQFDVKADLLNSLKRKDSDKKPFVDVLILSHGDEDHILGFEKNFYQGDPKNYSKSNLEKNEILIDELWFSPAIFTNDLCEDANKFKNEANRRLRLHNADDKDKDLPGNRIIIVGYDGKDKLEALHTVRVIPGEEVKEFNLKKQDTFSLFIHAPFKDQLQDSEAGRNHTSIVFQARFKNLATDSEYCCLAIFAGDADHYAIEMILSKTKKYKNLIALNWDLLLAPHHCSWTFFNNVPYEDNTTPQKYSLEFLDCRRANAKVIASCKEIKKTDKNPPHYEAKDEYVNKVGKDNFINTETDELVGKTPQPIVFEITSKGPVRKKENEGSAKSIGSSTLKTVNSTSGYGA